MNNVCLFAWMDDWQMSARLAKLSTLHSFELKFFKDKLQLSDSFSQILMIIDMDNVNEEKFQVIQKIKDDKAIFIL